MIFSGFVDTFWTYFSWVLRYPGIVLKYWTGGWIVALYISLIYSGYPMTLQLISILFNIGSIVGMSVPLVLISLQHHQVIQEWVLQGIQSIVSVISARMTGGSDVTTVKLANLRNKYRALKQTETDIYLGLDVDLTEKQDDFMRAIDDLMYVFDQKNIGSQSSKRPFGG